MQRVKDVVKETYSAALHGSGMIRAWRTVRGDRLGVAILNYHWIEPARFERHMRFLVRTANVVPLADAVAHVEGRANLPPGSVAITFDDGYADFYTGLYPIIQSLDLPVTLFVTTGAVDSGEPLWFNRLRAIVEAADEGPYRIGEIHEPIEADRRQTYRRLMRRLNAVDIPTRCAWLEPVFRTARADAPLLERFRPLSWEQLRSMRGRVSYGAHTVTHPNLAGLDEKESQVEIAESRARLEAELGAPIDGFAYPFGQPEHVSDAAVAAARSVGIAHAFTTSRGHARPGEDALRLPRFVCDDVPSGRVLAALLSGLWWHMTT